MADLWCSYFQIVNAHQGRLVGLTQFSSRHQLWCIARKTLFSVLLVSPCSILSAVLNTLILLEIVFYMVSSFGYLLPVFLRLTDFSRVYWWFQCTSTKKISLFQNASVWEKSICLILILAYEMFATRWLYHPVMLSECYHHSHFQLNSRNVLFVLKVFHSLSKFKRENFKCKRASKQTNKQKADAD